MHELENEADMQKRELHEAGSELRRSKAMINALREEQEEMLKLDDEAEAKLAATKGMRCVCMCMYV